MNRIDLVAEILLSALSRTSRDSIDSDVTMDSAPPDEIESDDTECLQRAS